MEPECIVLDEPTAMLDPMGRKDVIETIHRLNKEKGITIVLITHSQQLAEECPRILTLIDGRIVSERQGSEVPDHV